MKYFLLTAFQLCFISGLLAQNVAIDSTAKESELKEAITNTDILPSITLSDDDASSGDGQNVSNLLTASRDPFTSVAFFNFAAAGFRQRGYNWDEQDVYLNGVPMNDLERGNASLVIGVD